MKFFSLDTLLARPWQKSRRRRSATPQAAIRRLLVESLEDRTLLTISLSPTTLPVAFVDTPYAQTIAASGGVGNQSLVISNLVPGGLVAGLSFSGVAAPNGGFLNGVTITGTPTATGTQTFRVTATDSTGDSVFADYTLVVEPEDPVLPVPLVSNQKNLTVIDPDNPHTDHSPTVMIDPTDPTRAVAVYATGKGGDTDASIGILYTTNANTTAAAGPTWSSTFVFNTSDPAATTATNIVFYAQANAPSIAFDLAHNFYIVATETNANGSSGALVMQKYAFAGAAPSVQISNKILARWANGVDPVLNPVIGIDTNPALYTDTNPNGSTYSQTDTMSGKAIYVAWGTNNTAPADPGTGVVFNPNTIKVIASADGGYTFTTQEYVTQSNTGNPNFQLTPPPGSAVRHDTAPQIAFTADSRTTTGGQLIFLWNDFGNTALMTNISNPDGGVAGTAPVAAAVFTDNAPKATYLDINGNVLFVTNSSHIADPAPDATEPIVSRFAQNVNITDPTFTSLTDLEVTLNLVHQQLNELKIVLRVVTSDNVTRSVVLLLNRVDETGAQGDPPNGITGSHLGMLQVVIDSTTGTFTGNTAGTVFDNHSPRAINDASASAPFVGHFRPEAGSLSTFFGLTRNQLSGATWYLEVTDFRTDSTLDQNMNVVQPVQNLVSWSLNLTSSAAGGGFTSGFGTERTIPLPTNDPMDPLDPPKPGQMIAGSFAAPYPLLAPVSPNQGIATGAVIAVDNSLGAYSPYQGRIYIAYVGVGLNAVGGTPQNPVLTADSTDIWLLRSDNGGITWSTPKRVNNDTTIDMSEGNRPKFMPAIAVDQTTGTVVVTYYDARNDASRARVATYVATSMDGGVDFGPQTYLNKPKTSFDLTERTTVTLEPIPSNQGIAGDTFGFGSHQGVAVYGGHVIPVWSGNLNDSYANIFSATVLIGAGPRIIASDMGPVIADFNNSGKTYNNTFTVDGTRQLDAFAVTFDRPVDVSTFTPADVAVYFLAAGSTSYPGTLISVASVEALNATTTFGPENIGGLGTGGVPTVATKFLIHLTTPQSGVGTYSYSIGPGIVDRMRSGALITNLSAPTTFTSTNVPITFNSGPGANDATNGGTKVTSTLSVSALPDLIGSVTVGVRLDYPTDADLRLTLIAPDGTRVMLVKDGTVGGANYGSGAGPITYTVFDDAAANSIFGTTGNHSGTFRPYASLSTLIGKTGAAMNGTWTLEIQDYSQLTGGAVRNGNLISWQLTLKTGATSHASAGNSMDQNANAIKGEAATLTKANDVYVAPTPTNGGAPFQLPYSQDTLPLIIPGPHVVKTFVPNNGTVAVVGGGISTVSTVSAVSSGTTTFISTITTNSSHGLSQGQLISIAGTVFAGAGINGTWVVATVESPTQFTIHSTADPGTYNSGGSVSTIANPSDNLILNGTTNEIDVVFDRDMKTSTFTTTSVLRMMGPLGLVNGPFTVTPTADPHIFRIGFPTQQYSGTYVATFAPAVTDLNDKAVDTNFNAGLDNLRGINSQDSTITTTLYQSPDVPKTLNANSTVTSQIIINDSFPIQSISLKLDITYPRDADLEATLTAPDGTVVRLFTAVGGTGVNSANFSNINFDDAANIPIQSFTTTAPPANASYNPQTPLQDILNRNAKGTWTLTIKNNAVSAPGGTKTLNSWSLTLGKETPTTGLGDTVSDQYSASFRIFTMATSNNLSLQNWTAVGPASIASGERSGRIGGLAVDPSDPSGNTVFAGGASGGIWKTTNFLTTSANGPTWIPLTDFGPSFAINIGSIAVFPRNNDPRQSIVIAATGEGDTGSIGVGFIRSMDGGATWQLLDSINNNLQQAVGGGITAVTNTVNPTITTATPHGLAVGQVVTILGVNGAYGVNGTFTVASVIGAPLTSTQFTITLASAPGVYTSAGTVVKLQTVGNGIAGVTNTADPTITTNLAHKLVVGQTITITGTVFASPGAGINGTWVVMSTPTPFSFTIQRSAPGTWQSGGTIYAANDHYFLQQTTAFKVIVDPNLTLDNQVIIYAALSGVHGGLYRSDDTGTTWKLLRAGDCTDVALALPSRFSGTLGTDGNLQVVYAAFRGEGVYFSSNKGIGLALLAGGGQLGLIRDGDILPSGAIKVTAPTDTPNGVKGRIVLVTPFVATGDVLKDFFYSAWIYALVVKPDNHLDGLYVSKDFGNNWTKVQLRAVYSSETPVPLSAIPTNDEAQPKDVDPLGNAVFAQGNYDVSLGIDPTNPNIVYIGGTNDGQPQPAGGFIRVDITGLHDAHNFTAFQNNRNDGGLAQSATQGAVSLTDTSKPYGPVSSPGPYLNLFRDPTSPFGNSTVLTTNIPPDPATAVRNSGYGASWLPFNAVTAGSTDQHRLITMVDPLTGHARLILGDDQGVFTGVDNNGSLDFGIGTAVSFNGSRNGNLQITQFYQGASQPSSLAAQLANAFFYGMAQDDGEPFSAANILSSGNLNWTGPGGDGAGVATDQTGSGTAYQFRFPCCGSIDNEATNFFNIILPVNVEIARTGTAGSASLIQANDDPAKSQGQWHYVEGFRFAVNPVNTNPGQVDQAQGLVVSSRVGRVFRSTDNGRNWFVIAEPNVLDSTNAYALAFGAPDVGQLGNLDNFIYAGTNGGHIFVTFEGGGNWRDISGGTPGSPGALDGSPVQVIVTNPKRGSHEVYAVTQQGVYWMADSTAATPTWVNITGPTSGGAPIVGNPFFYKIAPFGDTSQTQTQLKYLTSLIADWRYAIPDNPANPNGPTHPVLYIGGEGGIFRSTDKGKTWTIFPSAAGDGAVRDGGLLPNAHVTSLSLATGNINTTTGQPDQSQGPNILLASTYGRGSFAIRLAPVSGSATPYSGPQVTNFTIVTPTSTAPTSTQTVNLPAGNYIDSVTPGVTTTIHTVTPHGLTGGDKVYINGVGGITGLNGAIYTIALVNSNTFTVTPAAPTTGTFTSGGFALPTVSSIYLTFNSTPVGGGITNVTYNAGTQRVTITTSTAHTLVISQSVSISGVVGATGVNGTFVVASVPSANTFTIALASSPGAYDSVNSRGRVSIAKAVDPDTFTLLDIVSFTGPGGAITATQITDVTPTPSGGPNLHNVYRIDFAPQFFDGVYTIVIGPNIADLSGNLMDQNGNGTNGQVPGDRVTGTFAMNTSDDGNFVAGLYRDVLGRTPDAGGLTAFVGPIDAARNALLANRAMAFIASPENLGLFVRRMYSANDAPAQGAGYMQPLASLLQRAAAATAGEVNMWVSQLQSGALTETGFINILVSSGEYFSTRAGNSNNTWVDTVYVDLLGRTTAGDPGAASFKAQLNANQLTRSQVGDILLNSAEFRNRIINSAFMTFLARPGDAGAFSLFGNLLGSPGPQSPTRYQQFYQAVIGSPEALYKAGNRNDTWIDNDLYRKLLGRAPVGGLAGADVSGHLAFMLDSYRPQRQSTAFVIDNSAEAHARLIRATYQTLLARQATDADVAIWLANYAAGIRDETLINAIVSSPEYFSTRAFNNNNTWVDTVYVDLLGRTTAGDMGAQTFKNQLNANQISRGQVASILLGSYEYRTRLLDSFFATTSPTPWMFTYMKRPGAAPHLTNGELNVGQTSFNPPYNLTPEQILAGITSPDVPMGYLLDSREYFLLRH